jgi:hypothetical protein
MNTPIFCLPLSESAKLMSDVHLRKFIVEAKQIHMAATGQSKAWANHPITKSWVGHEEALRRYAVELCGEYTRRSGRVHACRPYFGLPSEQPPFPAFFADPHVREMYRSHFARKSDHYARHFPGADLSMPFVYENGTVSKTSPPKSVFNQLTA